MNSTDTVRRSSLIMPVNQSRFVERAYTRGADAIVLDLEDAVPPAEKGRARSLVKDAIPVASRGSADVFVCINKPVEMMVEDLDAAIHPGLTGLALAKVETASWFVPMPSPPRKHGKPRPCVWQGWHEH